jgi:transketolase
MDIDPIIEKWKAFNWKVFDVDGHNIYELVQAFTECRKSMPDTPKIIIAKTIKGKGVSFMENKVAYHSAIINPEEYTLAMSELVGAVNDR